MTVYIEYVLIDNFIIDYLMLKASLTLTATRVSRVRLLFCAFFGAVFALFYPLISVNNLLLTAIKVCFGLLLVLFAGRFKTKKDYYVTAVTFFAYTFLTGGAVIGIFNILGVPYSTEISVAVMVVPVYFIFMGITSVIKFLYRQKEVVRCFREVEISAFGITKKGVGFYDTGNELYDGDNPVIVCHKSFAKEFLEGDFSKIKLKKLSVNTVNGREQNLAFLIEQLKIYYNDEWNIFNNVTLCVVGQRVGRNYDIILHPKLKENENEQAVIETKKAS